MPKANTTNKMIATMSNEERPMTTKEWFTDILLWTIAIAMALVMVCTAMAWIVGIVVFVMRLINV